MLQMLVMIAQQARNNFVVGMEQAIHKRLNKWLELKIRQNSVQGGGIQGGDYFTSNGTYNGKSTRWHMVRCCAEEVTDAGPRTSHTS